MDGSSVLTMLMGTAAPGPAADLDVNLGDGTLDGYAQFQDQFGTQLFGTVPTGVNVSRVVSVTHDGSGNCEMFVDGISIGAGAGFDFTGCAGDVSVGVNTPVAPLAVITDVSGVG